MERERGSETEEPTLARVVERAFTRNDGLQLSVTDALFEIAYALREMNPTNGHEGIASALTEIARAQKDLASKVEALTTAIQKADRR